jgi:ATP/maltotriose-dependent transcriptional regulator MalT
MRLPWVKLRGCAVADYLQIELTDNGRGFNLDGPSTGFGLQGMQERDVLIQLAQGSSNREIALALHVTEGTVKNYITRILSELGMRDFPKERLRQRMQAALWAQKHADALRSIQPTTEE